MFSFAELSDHTVPELSAGSRHVSSGGSTAVDPWLGSLSTTDSPSSPFGLAFHDVTNGAWGSVAGKNPNTRTAAPLKVRESAALEANRSHPPPEDMMLVKGDFLCASKLLQLAGAQQRSVLDFTTRSSATGDCDDSPSRDSTPMDVANAVLFGADDSPPPNRGAPCNHQAQQRLLYDDARGPPLLPASATSSTVAGMTALLQREFSCFSVSAGVDTSREGTPTSAEGSPTYVVANVAASSAGAATSSSVGGVIREGYHHRLSHHYQAAMMAHHHQHQQHHSHHTNVENVGGIPSSCVADPSARRAVRSHHVPTVTALPKVATVELTAPQTCVVVLEFKMGRRLRCRCSLDLSGQQGIAAVGQYFVVAVDATGFEDAGVCVSVVSMNERHTLQRTFGHADQGTVLRMANAADCDVINDVLPAMEEEALVQCHDLVHFLHIPFICVDAEYTLDRKGCKIFYTLAPLPSTSSSPNISRLQRELGTRLKCKVVLEQVRQ